MIEELRKRNKPDCVMVDYFPEYDETLDHQQQERMKAKRVNPPYRPYPKATPSKLFLDQSRFRKSHGGLEIDNPVTGILRT